MHLAPLLYFVQFEHCINRVHGVETSWYYMGRIWDGHKVKLKYRMLTTYAFSYYKFLVFYYAGPTNNLSGINVLLFWVYS